MHRITRLALAAGLTTAISTGAASAAIYADRIDWSGGGSGWDATTPTYTSERDNPGDALGAPDQVGNTEGGFLSLGIGGIAVFGFAQAFQGAASVFEVTFNCTGPGTGGFCDNYQESADVYVLNGDYTPSDTGFGLSQLASFTKVGSIANGLANEPGGASISIGGPFTYLALVDTNSRGDGFDVDAVSVSPVPVPPAALALGLGLGALGFAARRQRRRA